MDAASFVFLDETFATTNMTRVLTAGHHAASASSMQRPTATGKQQPSSQACVPAAS
jgi:hypothetical protein